MKVAIYITREDRNYLSFFEPLLPPAISKTITESLPTTISSALLDVDCIITSNPAFVKQLTQKNKCSLDDYAGSLWTRKDIKGREVEILCIPPLKQLITKKPGKFLCRRFLSKLFKKADWAILPEFNWKLGDDLIGWNEAFDFMSRCDCIATDIETSPAYEDWEKETNPRHLITCVAYCGILFGDGGNDFTTRTFVVPVKSLEALRWIRKINALTIPKIFQNGKYDNFYFLRFNAPVSCWYFDTLEAHHSFFSELPKNLGYISAFYLRDIAFWKDEANTGNLEDLYRYNAKDAWATALVFLTWIKEAPEWAIKNYLMKFPLIFACLTAELDGLLIDQTTLSYQKIEQNKKLLTNLSKLQKKLSLPFFNPSSPPQCLALLKLLGAKKETNADEKALERVADLHPINRVLIDEIKDFREARKLISTYLEAELWNGKLLYTLNPSGTDTGRLASRESQLWCGTQLQNLPPYFKHAIWAEEGFFLGEGDNEQSESRCSAYLSGDENLIAAVESPKDFHCTNAAAFFGLPYEQILAEEAEAKKQQIKPFTIRDLSKRVNHGATYNMGDKVLLATMGAKNVLRAKTLLHLPAKWTLLQVCQYLLKQFEKTYPVLKGDFYDSIKAQIKLSKMLVSPLGWTRLCFGNPGNNKPDLNTYIAHAPQNLSVGIINEAFVEVFHKLHLRTAGAFRLKGQIHDSILFAYKEDRVDLAIEAAKIMTRPKKITDCKGVERWMTIPVSLKGEARRWTELRKISLD